MKVNIKGLAMHYCRNQVIGRHRNVDSSLPIGVRKKKRGGMKGGREGGRKRRKGGEGGKEGRKEGKKL